LPVDELSSFDLAGHFNGNSNTDLLVYVGSDTSGSPSEIDFLTGNGAGSFTNNGAVTNLPINPGTALVADVNGDGKDDIIFVQPGCDALSCPSGGPAAPGSVSVMLSEGNGKFVQGYADSLPDGLAVEAVVGDFNKDGKPDFAVLVYPPDMMVPNPPAELYVFLNQGNGLFAPTIYQTPADLSDGIHTTNLVTGDFEGNGNLDLAFAFGIGAAPVIYPEIMTFAGDGKGDFGPGVVEYTLTGYQFNGEMAQWDNALVATDLNGDGRTDLVINLIAQPTQQRSQARVVMANLIATSSGGFQWGSAVTFAAETDISGFGVSDVNGDGHPDLLFTASGNNSSGAIYNYGGIYLGTASGTFLTPHVALSVPGPIVGPYLAAVPLKTGALPSLLVSNSKDVLLLFINTTQ
jgi:hypothetical protein